MLSYYSKTNGIGGTIKNKPEDFLVEEIGTDGKVFEINKKVENQNLEGKFTHFILQKTDWTTADAIKRVGKQLRISHTRFNFAGTKDKTAVSTQLVSVFGIDVKRIENLQLRDIDINGAWTSNEKVRLGQLSGNRFTIRVLSNDDKDKTHLVYKIYNELEGKMPNYFGEQRFGSTRRNTHIIGELLLKGMFKEAIWEYLTNSEGELHEESKSARKELLETQDYSKALKEFPKHLRMERTLIACLEKNPTDYVNAFRKLPRNIILLFIHAFQSNLFNIDLSERIASGINGVGSFCGENSYGFPDPGVEGDKWEVGKLIGYETELSEHEKELLEKFGVKSEDFKMKNIPEINSKGGFRTLFTPLKNFSFADNIFRFELNSGSYATVALREFLESKN